MKLIFNLLLFILLIGSFQLEADVQINSYRKNFSWKSEWSDLIKDELKKDDYRSGAIAFLNIQIDEKDLDQLECAGYNKSSFEDKSDFWVVFFSALTRAESAFNAKARSALNRGHRSYGLLQLAKQTAKSQCRITSADKSILNPKDNLLCGLTLMNWQLQGAPVREGRNKGKKLRSDFEGQIFGKHIFQWGPLRQNDHRGKALLINWFKDHLDQLKFCKI